MSFEKERDRQIRDYRPMPALVRAAWDYSVALDSFVQVDSNTDPELCGELQADLDRLRAEIIRLVRAGHE